MPPHLHPAQGVSEQALLWLCKAKVEVVKQVMERCSGCGVVLRTPAWQREASVGTERQQDLKQILLCSASPAASVQALHLKTGCGFDLARAVKLKRAWAHFARSNSSHAPGGTETGPKYPAHTDHIPACAEGQPVAHSWVTASQHGDSTPLCCICKGDSQQIFQQK